MVFEHEIKKMKIGFDFVDFSDILFNVTSELFNSSTSAAASRGSSRDRAHPLCSLPEEDLNLITELVLASGSLKALASAYRVSYPTIRGRLDQTIARLQDAVQGREADPVTSLLGKLVEQGELSVRNARAIQDVITRARNAASGDADVRAGG